MKSYILASKKEGIELSFDKLIVVNVKEMCGCLIFLLNSEFHRLRVEEKHLDLFIFIK